ncbi:helix-turn-helix transcriptional regulator, partial [Pseudomonas aeruginosa]
MPQNIGDRIRQIRGGLGVGEFAERLGVNRKTVARWESNEALPDGASLLTLHS